MTHIKAYVKRLNDNTKLGSLVPADVPNCAVMEKTIAYLTKDELALLMRCLEHNVLTANASGNKHTIYSAYLWRAVVWMLYTA